MLTITRNPKMRCGTKRSTVHIDDENGNRIGSVVVVETSASCCRIGFEFGRRCRIYRDDAKQKSAEGAK